MEPIWGLNVSRPRVMRTDLWVPPERRGEDGEVEECGPDAGGRLQVRRSPRRRIPSQAHQTSGQAPALRVFQVSGFISEIPLMYGLLVQLDEGRI